MFWGCISVKYDKANSLFWEKNWGSISQILYCEHIFPMVWNYIYCGHLGLQFQQNRGPGQNTMYTLA